MAPELGLFLDECIYDSYNRRFRESHEPVNLVPFQDQVLEFKHRVIYPHIANTEEQEKTVQQWLRSLNARNFADFQAHTEEAKVDAS